MERNLYAYEYVGQAFDDVVELLASKPESVLQSATDDAHGRVRQFVEHLHVDVQGFEVGRDVVVQLGTGKSLGKHTVSFPLAWHAEDSAALFPALTGHLEVAAMSFHPPLSQVTFTGKYHPPLGLVGAAADAMVGKRIAEAAVHHFIKDLTTRLDHQLTSNETQGAVA